MNIGSLELAANHNINQIVDVCEEHEKQSKLYNLLEEIGSDKLERTIIFVETKKKAEAISNALRREGCVWIGIMFLLTLLLEIITNYFNVISR